VEAIVKKILFILSMCLLGMVIVSSGAMALPFNDRSTQVTVNPGWDDEPDLQDILT
jgi:Na+-transporting NADH:ubiquinone oxidoreductase subunit NqrC